MTAAQYHSGSFPPVDLDWPRLLPLIGPAQAAVARYEGILHGVPNPDILVSPLIVQEAVLSSRIEGTQATFDEVLEYEAEGDLFEEDTPKTRDIAEIINYRAALYTAIDRLESLPLSQRLLKYAHAVLMRGVRGQNKAPGEYRRIPVWIGPERCPIEQATFVPCSAEHVPAAMDTWERYLHSPAPDTLVQLALVHAEFEAIHPFLDGNGRLGRLMIPLFLYENKLLSRPNFYLSEYLESHRSDYYDRLQGISSENDWTGWCAFFLQAVITQAGRNLDKAQAILALYRTRKDWIIEATHSQYGIRALDWMFTRMIFKTSDFIAKAEIPKPTANRILRIAREQGMLRELRPASGRRPAILAFPELLAITEGSPVV